MLPWVSSKVRIFCPTRVSHTDETGFFSACEGLTHDLKVKETEESKATEEKND